MRRHLTSGCLLLLLLLGGCIDSFSPAVLTTSVQLLVVDGFINSNDVTTIRLFRSQNLTSADATPLETAATVTIEDENGLSYPLTEKSPGVYTSARQKLPTTLRYRLHIRTSTGREYASDYAQIKTTPPIDAFYGAAQPNGLQLYISTHDASGQSQYYRWEYVETWEFTSPYRSTLVYDGKQVVFRNENIYNCWRTEPSTNIVTTSTVRLSQDAVRDFRLLFIPSSAGRLRYKYSILVRQYALSQAEFDYWEAVKKNTENIGTLFDPLPSQVQGNVHCLSAPDEPVLGFVGATSVVEQRIFIDRISLPDDWRTNLDGYEHCLGLDTFPSERWRGWTLNEYFSDPAFRTPVSWTGSAFTAQLPECIDCRLRGTNVKPSYWP